MCYLPVETTRSGSSLHARCELHNAVCVFEMIHGLRSVICITTEQESVHECVTIQEDKRN